MPVGPAKPLLRSPGGGRHRRHGDPDQRQRLGRELREDKKEQDEHALVVQQIREVLARHTRDLRVAESPRLLALEGIQHLETPIEGELSNGATLLELVGELHPTPAVGGVPREPALRWLESEERLDRGLYAGPVGWIDARGEGEFCVALRSALIENERALLIAGAGIVAGSKPDAELRETRLKLRTLLSPLLEL